MPQTYVIADLHGRFDLLQAALATIAQHANGRACKIVTLGDYVDRGPQSRQVVERLMAVQAAGTNLICLKGNHEYMMHRALTLTWFASASRARCLNWWKHNGGESTLASYGNKVPSDHLRWMKNLPTIYVDQHRIFVHAGVDPKRALDEQTDEFLLWHRYSEGADIGHEGRHVVHGHTANRKVPRGCHIEPIWIPWPGKPGGWSLPYSTIRHQVRRSVASSCRKHGPLRCKWNSTAMERDATWFPTWWLEPSHPWQTTERETIRFAISIS